MTKKEYMEMVKNSGLTIAELVNVLDHNAVLTRLEDGEKVSSHISLAIVKETSKFDAKSGVLKSDGYTVKPYIKKGYDKDGNESWAFSPNKLKLQTKASRYTYVLENGKITTTKEVKNYDNDNKTHINEVNESAIKYLNAKKANEINIEKALNEIIVSVCMRLDNAIEKLSEEEKTLNKTSVELLNAYKARKAA